VRDFVLLRCVCPTVTTSLTNHCRKRDQQEQATEHDQDEWQGAGENLVDTDTFVIERALDDEDRQTKGWRQKANLRGDYRDDPEPN
jgi:hypothetical protein